MNVIFPITFPFQCFTVVGCDAIQSTSDKDGVDWAIYISDFGTTEFRVSISDDRNTMSYVAFGVQQWGYIADNTSVSTYQITLNLSVNYLFFADSITQNHIGAQNTEGNPRIIGLNNGKLNINSGVSSHRTGVFWFMVGKQQWGRFSAAGTYSFPIAFSIFYGIANAGITRTYDDYAYQFKDITTTQFYGYTNASMTMTYLALGIQQWGTYNSGTTWDTYFTFPITFPTACYAGCVADIYDGDKNEDVYYRAQPTTSQFRLRVGAGFNCPHMIIVIGR